MLNHESIVALLESLPDKSYRKYLSDRPATLSAEMGSALGTDKRRLVRVLETTVEAIAAKLYVESLTLTDTNADATVKDWLTANGWDLLERELWKTAVRDGTTYVLVSYTDIPRLHKLDAFDGKTGAALVYADTDKSAPLFGLNTWYVNDQRYLDVYYPNRIEKYLYDGREWNKRKDTPSEQWPLDWTDNDGAPLGIPLLPVTIGESDLANGAVQLQHDINEALLDLLAVSRTQGFPLRYLKGAKSLEYLTNSYGQPLYNSAGMPIKRTVRVIPGAVMPLGDGEELGQLDSAVSDTAVLDKLLHMLTLVTTVPNHYFTGDWPSGVALIQSEMRLNHKVEEHQGYLTRGLKAIINMMLRLSNVFSSTAYPESDIEIVWFSPEIETEDLRLEKLTKTAQAVTLLLGAGAVSTETAVRMLHPEWEESDVQLEVSRIRASSTIAGL